MEHKHHAKSSVNFLDSDEILEKLDLKGNEAFMDAGCGDGHIAITALKKYLPDGLAYAVDSYDISINELDGKTYFLVDPSIYMFENKVNYIMPKNILVSNKYSNLVRFINDNAMWALYDIRNKAKINRFIYLLKTYGIVKNELEDFIQSFITLSEEQALSIDKTSDRGKELALKTLENKAWVEIYRDNIVKEF